MTDALQLLSTDSAPPRRARRASSPALSPSGDSYAAYLREVGRVALLSAEQEVSLALAIEVGLLAGERLEVQCDLDAGLRLDLARLVAKGEAAKVALVAANLRLVVSLAKRYVGRGLPVLDLVQEGNLGLIRAVEKFDYQRGYKFSTYASWWIRQAVSRAVADQGRTIRMPVHTVELANRVRRARHDLVAELGREPTPDEVAARADLPRERVTELTSLARDPVSLHAPVGETDGAELGELLEDDQAQAPGELVAATLLAEHLDAVLAELSRFEQAVVRLRYGLVDGRARTWDEVGALCGVGRDRARQVEARVLTTLRQPHYASQLHGYLED